MWISRKLNASYPVGREHNQPIREADILEIVNRADGPKEDNVNNLTEASDAGKPETESGPVDHRRLASLIITGDCVASLARAGRRSIDVSSPVPETASFFTSYFDHSRNAYVAIFEDASFDRVPEGAVIPLLTDPCVVTEAKS